MSLLDLVNPLQGTKSHYDLSTGNTLPLVGVLRGLTYWTQQTSDERFFFDGRAVKLAGFRATHSPSPWMGDYGHFDVMPVVGTIAPTPKLRASSFDSSRQISRPNMYRAQLLRYGVDVEMTATRACGVFRFAFPSDAGETAAIVLQTGKGDTQTLGEIAIRENRIVGISRSHNGGVAENFGCYFVAEIEGAEIIEAAVIDDKTIHRNQSQLRCPRAGAYFRIRPNGPVVLRISTSFINHQQAVLNLSREAAGRSFEEISAETEHKWERWLQRIQADGGTQKDRICLYSAMYRVGLYPTPMHEFDASNRPLHYSPHDGQIHSGVFFTNNGFWDTHRTVYPLLSLIDRDGFAEIAEGFLQHYRQGGWLPKWCSPGYRDCMIGSHADVVLAEAIAAGIEGIDVDEAYEAMRKNAFEPVYGHAKYGRAALNEYMKLGYVPSDASRYSVSWTLDNAHCDWCIAQVATKLGRHDDARILLARSKNYRNLWHAKTGFMRPKDSNGDWIEPWNEFGWGHAYVEGGPWQHSFHVPHDPYGLAELCGGVDALICRLDEMFATPPRFEIGHYGAEIHEMTEMALARDEHGQSFGQYAHSNQPVHGYLWLPAALGRVKYTAHHVARVMRSLYKAEDLPGDEDNGEMSAWYILGALGKIPLCPGSAKFMDVPSPLFDQVTISSR